MGSTGREGVLTRAPTAPPAPARDPRLPAPGGVIERVFKGTAYRVEVSENGFVHAGQVWKSLTALAMHVTGYRAVSGPAFFGLTKPTPKPKPLPAPAAPPAPPAPTKRKAGRPIAPRRTKGA